MTSFEGRSGRAAGNDAPEDVIHNTQSDEMKNAAQSAKTAPLILDRIPLHKHDAKDKEGRPQGKSPLLSGWLRTPALTDAEVAAHVGRKMNVGARLRDDQLVIDADPRTYKDGVTSLDKLVADFRLPYAPKVETGGGGYHIYLRKPEGMRLRDRLDGYPGVEFKTWGRQVVVPPSIHPNGRRYKWDLLLGPDMAVPNAPDTLLDQLQRPSKPSVTSDDKWSSEELRVLLGGLDARKFNSNALWEPIAMLSHYETNGNGLDVFLDWCATDTDYADRLGEVRTRWASFSTEKEGRKWRRGTLYKVLNEAGRGDLVDEAKRSDPQEDFPTYDDDDSAEIALLKVRWPNFSKKGDIIKPCYNNVRMAVEAGNLGVGW